MKNFIGTVLLFCLVSMGTSKTIHEPTLSTRWKRIGKLFKHKYGQSLMTVTLVLQHSNLKELERYVAEVSTPGSKSYGKHMTAEQVNQLTRPSTNTHNTVRRWLKMENLAGKTRTFQGGSAITIEAPVEEIERTFNTKVDMVTDGKKVKFRAAEYTLPEGIVDHVVAVFGLHGLPLPQAQKKHNKTVKGSNGIVAVTPAVIGTTYNISGAKGSGNQKNRQAVGEYEGENFNPSDNTQFFQTFVKDANPDESKLFKVVGANAQAGPSGTEAALDVEYVMGVAPGILTEFWGFMQQDFCQDLLLFTAKILDTPNAPNVFSISYGWTAPLSELGCTQYEVQAVDINLQKLGLRGISMIIASQDNGVACGQQQCWASWPSTSPYATSVGATRFINQDQSQGEMASDQFGSGGGFSTRFNRSKATSWQEQAVQKYLSTAPGLPPPTFFPKEGRAVPDVSALGEGYQTVVNGGVEAVGGTSAATPAFAAMVSLLNEARAKQGKPPMGFLNPFLYQNPQAFNDITQGNNKIGRGGQKMTNGYECTVGWDPVTGLGTPKFGSLLVAALKH